MNRQNSKKIFKIVSILFLIVAMNGGINPPAAKAFSLSDALNQANDVLRNAYDSILKSKDLDEDYKKELLERIQKEGVPQVEETDFLQKIYQATIKLSPENPGANETVRANVQTFGFNRDEAYFNWTINGETEAGQGKNSVEFKTGAIGSQTAISSV